MICEGLKLLLTPFVTYLISWLYDDVYWSDLGNGFEYLGSEHDQVFAYFLVNIFISFVGYFIGMLACSMAIQKLSFALPITLMTPYKFFHCTWLWKTMVAMGLAVWAGTAYYSMSVNLGNLCVCRCVFCSVFVHDLLHLAFSRFHHGKWMSTVLGTLL